MLIRFTVENYRSFYEETVFSMYPGQMKSHAGHIITGNATTDIDVLRMGLLYGANTSGKSNLIKAMAFAQQMIVNGVKPKQRLKVEPFKLKTAAATQPSRFEFEFISHGQAYAYGFSLDSHRIHEEWLYLMNKQSEQALFERTTTPQNETTVSFPTPKLLTTDDEQFLQFVARSTRPNQLFLSQSIEDNVTDFEPIFEWFHKTLIVIFPHSRFKAIQILIHKDEGFREALSTFLREMNTGIESVCLNLVENHELIPIPNEILSELLDDLTGESISIIDLPNTHRYMAQLNKQQQVDIYALGTTRRTDGGQEISFEMQEESDGTQRLVDLFPVIHSAEPKLFVIDELERSLHPNLVRRFLEYMLQSKIENQLIVSTHEATLLDLDLLRRDEIWFVEKTPHGNSTLYSLEEFKPRKDLDIRKGYLQGRFGAIPILGSSLTAPVAEPAPDAA